MHELDKKRLDQMIEHAVSYKQNSKYSSPWYESLKNRLYLPAVSGVAIAVCLLMIITFYPKDGYQAPDDVNEIYDLVTLEILNDVTI